MEFIEAVVLDILDETTDTKTFFLQLPESKAYKAGQYVTVEIPFDNKKLRRAYSISSSPHESFFSITVKKIDNGLVSNKLHDVVKVNDIIRLHVGEGNFYVIPNALNEKTYIFISAGSGITPVFSMIKSLLKCERNSKIILLYGSRNENEIIFGKQLCMLEKEYSDNLKIIHCISKPGAEWTGEKGRLTDMKLENLIDTYVDMSQNIYLYTCGPLELMQTAQQVFRDRGLSVDRMHYEVFNNPLEIPNEISENSGVTKVNFSLDKKTYTIDISKKNNILDTILDEGYDAPYSCMSGSCGSCKAKITHGNVRMLDDTVLTKNEKENGYVLTCQSFCLSDEVTLTYDIR